MTLLVVALSTSEAACTVVTDDAATLGDTGITATLTSGGDDGGNGETGGGGTDASTLADGGDGGDGGAVRWVSVGPGYANGNSGKLVTLARDPNATSHVLAGGDNGGPGVLRSTDGGSTWSSANAGLLATDGTIDSMLHALWFVPGASGVVLALADHGIYRSTDGGATWANTRRFAGGSYGLDGVDLFASTGSAIFCATPDGLLTSTDGGVSWSIADATGATNVIVQGGTLWFSGTDAALYRRDAGGFTKRATLRDQVHQFAIDPANAKVIYASVSGGSYNYDLFASSDGGATFAAITYPSGLLGVQSIAFSATKPHVLYLAGDGQTVTIAADGARAPTTTTVRPDDDVRHLYVESNAAGSDDRCTTADDQGIHVMETCSDTASMNVGLGSTLRTNLVTGFAVSSDGQNVMAMLQDFAGASSQSAGSTWSELGDINEDGTAAFSPSDSKRCFAFSQAWFVSTDGCKSVTKKADFGGPTYAGQAIVFDPTDAMHLYAVSSDGTVYASTDGGDSMSSTSWPFTKAQALAVDPTDGKHLMLFDATAGVQRSTDGGAHWAASTGGVTGLGQVLFAMHPFDRRIVLALGVDASNAMVLFGSVDGGASFETSPRWWMRGGEPMGIAFNPVKSGSPLLAVTTNYEGAFLSSDEGGSFTRIDQSLITHKYTSLQWSAGVLYLGTYGQGILKSDRALQ